jgi:hypothetical protein
MRLYRFTFVVGFAAGFVAGTRAGRERYDQMVKMAKTTMESPQFQQAVGVLQAQGSSLLSAAGQKVADAAPKLAESAKHAVQDHVPTMKHHRDGHGDGQRGAANGKAGSRGRPFAATSNSHVRPTDKDK